MLSLANTKVTVWSSDLEPKHTKTQRVSNLAVAIPEYATNVDWLVTLQHTALKSTQKASIWHPAQEGSCLAPIGTMHGTHRSSLRSRLEDHLPSRGHVTPTQLEAVKRLPKRLLMMLKTISTECSLILKPSGWIQIKQALMT